MNRTVLNLIAVNIISVMIIAIVANGVGGMNTYKIETVRIALPYAEPSQYNIWGSEFAEEDVECLAQNIYFEARGESIDGQYAVSEVVMHRYMSHYYPNTVCGVVKDARYNSWSTVPVRHKCQFSWWCDGKSDIVTDLNAYLQAREIAEDILNNSEYDLRMDYALFYHNHEVSPHWVAGVSFVASIGFHSFYR